MNARAQLSRSKAAAILSSMNEDERRVFAERVAARAAELFAKEAKDALGDAVRQAFAEMDAARKGGA